MSNNSQRNVSGIAREIQDRLRSARGPTQPEASAANSEKPPTEGANTHHVTKDGRLVRPDEQLPTGANGQPVSFSSLPAATFHARSDR